MALCLQIHPEDPQRRLLKQVAVLLGQGSLMVYPTDSSYALGCTLDASPAIQRMRQIRGLDNHHHLTLICRDLSEISRYALLDDRQFRLLKRATPGPFTFLLQATKAVPKRLQHPKRNTIGIRIPRHPIVQGLLEELGAPLLSTTLTLPGAEDPLCDPSEIRDLLAQQVEVILDGGPGGLVGTTVVDLLGDTPQIVRLGIGDPVTIGVV